MDVVIGQRELRNQNAEIIRRVEAGERFTVTKHGVPIADLVPHEPTADEPRRSLGAIQAELRSARPIDRQAWNAQRRADDEIFGPDDPLTDEWTRRPASGGSDASG